MSNRFSFDSSHYVPVLRLKSAEMGALCKLHDDDIKSITPLIEPFPDILRVKEQKRFRDASDKELIFHFAATIGESWALNPFFIDLGMVEGLMGGRSDGHILSDFFLECNRLSMKPIPVTGINRSSEFQRAVFSVAQYSGFQVAIRVLEFELLEESFRDRILGLLKLLRLAPSNCHLIVDLKSVSENSVRLPNICERVPLLSEWATFTVIGGSFPEDLTTFRKNGQYIIPRYEIVRWREFVISARRKYRHPSFGDYTIQHPNFVPLPPIVNVSASIRYSSESHYVVMRGQWLGTPDGPGAKQYNAQAMLLIERPEYLGADFSYGDQAIKAKANLDAPPGGPREWVEIGINHHVSLTARQVSEISKLVPVGEKLRLARPTLPKFWPTRRLSLRQFKYQEDLFRGIL